MDKKAEPAPRIPHFPMRGNEPFRLKTVTLDASMAISVPGALVSTLSEQHEIWFIPQISHIYIKCLHPKYAESPPQYVHATRASGWTVD